MDALFEDILKQLRICDVGALHSHEETLPSNLLRLKEAMLNIGQLVDPLLVDEKSRVVLDGNHRIKVLSMIKCPRAVCQFVDYSRQDIKVGTWFPVSEKILPETVRKAGFALEAVDFEAGLKALASKKAPFMVAGKRDGKREYSLVQPDSYDLEGMMAGQKKILEKLNGGETSFQYYSDEEAAGWVEKGKTVLYRKIYTKEEIVGHALKGKVFTPKSTRHVIPNRIIRLNMRLGWLHEGETEANAYLERILRERVYNGNIRRYSEPVIVIY
ncbi:MAG: hypothetical protein PHS02_02295 [Candidatus ainarchaeum sp.]|nr:hypothetical protein [Candidatus ainarchaeum sp.]